MSDEPAAAVSDAQLRWQCRRGMRELDVLLTRYLERHYPQAGEERKRAFRELLTLADPELAAYLLRGRQPRDPRYASIVSDIRSGPAT